MLRRFGLLPVFALALSWSACGGSSSDAASPPNKQDSAVDTGAKTDTGFTDRLPTDGGGCDKTTGKKCTTDEDCNVSGAGISKGTREGVYAAGSYDPTPVCIGVGDGAGTPGCTPTDTSRVEMCDCGTGICYSTSRGGICFPYCKFDDTGSAPVGCEGRNLCNVYAWGRETDGKLLGAGICFGGCHQDSDCVVATEKCQVETSLCVKALATFIKAVGEPCSEDDAKKCYCAYYPKAPTKGVCTSICRVGDPSWGCPTGFSCTAELPKTDDKGDVLWTTQPKGVAGSCMKNCTSDTDCTATFGACVESAGMGGQKTCRLKPP